MSLSIGIACYPSVGGSGVVATQIGEAMARRGHTVHFFADRAPLRLDPAAGDVRVHEVRAPDYPVFPYVPYALALASAMIHTAQHEGLDLIHAHYAVPHAASGWMAREVIGGGVRLITTLHGTDTTLIGSDPSYLPITRHSILSSDAVTAPSAWLVAESHARFGLEPARTPIQVLPNFVDVDRFRPCADGEVCALRRLLGGFDGPVLVHASNFRPLKHVERVVDVFARVLARQDARLVLIGDGPTRDRVAAHVDSLGLGQRVRFTGERLDLHELVRGATAFVLPSSTESFGLAALEALSSGVPVIASGVGGLPEVIHEGRTGFLLAPDDVDGMAARALALIERPGLRASMSTAARQDVLARFRAEPIIDRYEALYERTVAGRASGGGQRRVAVQ